MYRIEYQPRLIEEAVLRAIVGRADKRLFRKERDGVYGLADADEREEAFQKLHLQWFARLRLAAPLEEALACWPILKNETDKCLLTKAQSQKEIGADLFVAQTPLQRMIVIRLTAELLTQPHELLPFLRHELMHIVDMLDPDFAYEPELPACAGRPKSAIGPTYDRLLRDRYRVLWDITIDGRLVQKGWLESNVKNRHWLNFQRTFSGPPSDLETIFSFFFNNQRPAHADLVSFAQSPESWFVNSTAARPCKGLCSICNFPAFQFVNPKTDLSQFTCDQIQKEIPDWQPDQPVCRQCADLYESRVLIANAIS